MNNIHRMEVPHRSEDLLPLPNDEGTKAIKVILSLNPKIIEKFISISIEYLDSLDGDPDLEQDNVDEPNGDEGDFSYAEWRAA